MPPEKRNESNEKAIAESLKDFFATEFNVYTNKCRRKTDNGIVMGITGIVVLTINSFISFKSSDTAILVALRVITEPAGWFLLWASFDFLFYDRREIVKEREFFRELSELNIHFRPS